MPVKWKIFRVLNYLHIAGVTGFLLLLLYGILTMPFPGFSELFVYLLIFIIIAIPLSNCIINLYLLDRCYPDQMPGNTLHSWSVVLFILFLFTSLLLYILGYFAFSDVLTNHQHLSFNSRRTFSSLLLSLLLVTAIPVIWLQVSLRKTIQRNYQKSIDSFLNTGPVED